MHSMFIHVLVWGLGFAFASIVTFWSWIGAIVLPFIHKPVFKKILAFMIALACATVITNSLIKFIPLVNFIKHIIHCTEY
jgi:hypothetical protein